MVVCGDLQLDYAARVKSPEKAVKAYAEAVALLDQVIAST